MRETFREADVFNTNLSGWSVDNVTQCGGFILNADLMSTDKIPNFTNCNPD